MTTPALRTDEPVAGQTDLGSAEVRAVAGCYFVASFAALGLPPYLTDILPALGDSGARWAGVLYVVPTVFSALAGPLWGRLADRLGHKPLLLRAQLGLAVAFLLAGLAESLLLFTAALVLQGVLGGTYAASTGFLGASLRDPTAIARALTLMQVAARASLVAAPVTVGALSPWVPPQRQYLLLAVLPLAAALLLFMLPAPMPAPATGAATGSAAEPAHRPQPVAALYALEFAFVFSTVISFPYLVSLVREQAPGTGPATAGWLFAVPHLCFLAAAMPLHGVLSRHPTRSLAAGFAFVAVGLATHAVAGSTGGFLLVRLGLGAGLVLGLVGLAAVAAEAVRGRAPGRTFGWVELFSKGGAVCAGLAASALTAGWGPAAPVLAGAAAAAVTALVLLLRPAPLPPVVRRRAR